MRRAEREDAWRRVGRDWPAGLGIRLIQITDLPAFEHISFSPVGGMTIFCGPNGSGKTRLLRAVASALAGEAIAPVELTLAPDHADLTAEQRSVAVYDPIHASYKQRLSLQGDPNIHDRIEQVDTYHLRDKELALVSYLMGRDYDSVIVRELEDDTRDVFPRPQDAFDTAAYEAMPDVVPYFEVHYRGEAFSGLELSQGELAGLSLLWVLRDCLPDSFLLIEEPESFLSPLSAERVLDVVAKYAGERKVTTLISSHSFLGIANAPQEHLVLLDAASGSARSVDVSTQSIWATLRVRSPRTVLLLVEDAAAAEWLLRLLRSTDYPHFDETEVLIAGDAGQVRQGAAFPQCQGQPFTVFGVLDGDERAHGGGERILFLPGTEPVERLVMDVLGQAGAEEVPLPWAEDLVREALSRTEGDEIHDRVEAIAAHLGVPVAELRGACTAAWLGTEAGTEALSVFVESLKSVTPPGSYS